MCRSWTSNRQYVPVTKPLAARLRHSHEGSRTLGRSSAAVIACGWFDLLAPLVVVILIAQNATEASTTEVLTDGLFLGGISAIGAIVLSARLVGTPYGVRLNNFVTWADVPAGDLDHVTAEQGLRLVLRDGRSLAPACYGGSLIGQWTGERRANVAKRRIEDWLSEVGQAEAHVGPPTVRPRIAAIGMFVGLPIAWALVGLVTLNVA